MGALSTLALAFAPRFIQFFVHHKSARTGQPEGSLAASLSGKAGGRRKLSCHWERAADGSLVAHWVRDVEPPSRGFGCAMLSDVPSSLIDAAYRYERRGSVPALIAVSRMARMHQPKYALRLVVAGNAAE